MRAKYFIQQFDGMHFQHGGVTCADAETVLLRQGFIPIRLPAREDFSLKAKISRFWYLLRLFFVLPGGAWVAFLFPVYARMNQWLIRLLTLRGLRPVCIIADIEGLRDNDPELLEREKTAFRRWKYFVVHNEKMRDWVLQCVPKAECALLGCFDFIADPVAIARIQENSIAFAGNLEKGPFVKKLGNLPNDAFRIHLYGPGLQRPFVFPSWVEDHGVFSPRAMPSLIQGAYGLIWDGKDMESCTGPYGEYLRLNTQHKLSLYILAGQPVLVWKEAATAEFVLKEGIGRTIASLQEIPDVISKISDLEYLAMREKMRPIAKKISEGRFLAEALETTLTRKGV